MKSMLLIKDKVLSREVDKSSLRPTWWHSGHSGVVGNVKGYLLEITTHVVVRAPPLLNIMGIIKKCFPDQLLVGPLIFDQLLVKPLLFNQLLIGQLLFDQLLSVRCFHSIAFGQQIALGPIFRIPNICICSTWLSLPSLVTTRLLESSPRVHKFARSQCARRAVQEKRGGVVRVRIWVVGAGGL